MRQEKFSVTLKWNKKIFPGVSVFGDFEWNKKIFPGVSVFGDFKVEQENFSWRVYFRCL